MPELKPANENPWYVLMTLYGEQEGAFFDLDLHERNREAWNAWAGSQIGESDREATAKRGIHIPPKSKWSATSRTIKARHKSEMMRRNGEGFAYPGFPNEAMEVDLDKTEFSRPFVARRFVFRSARFTGSVFRNSAVLDSATFMESAFFDSATFIQDAVFTRTTFKETTVFQSASFNGTADFFAASFTADAHFSNATFAGPVEFSRATFSRDAVFQRATFNGPAEFIFATFTGEARFRLAVFSNHAKFVAGTFQNFADFSGAEFGRDRPKSTVLFTDAHFAKPTNFRAAIFHSTYPNFDGAVLHEKTTFSTKGDSDDIKYWPFGQPMNPDAARASCAIIRHNVGKQGLPEDEHFFFRKEMEFAGQVGGRWHRLPYWLFGVVSEYGNSIERPNFWLILLLAFPANAYLWEKSMTGRGFSHDLLSAYFFSGTNILGFLRLRETYFPDVVACLPGWLQFLSAFQ